MRFLGYDPAVAKTFAFVVAAGMAGAAGAVAAPIIGIVAPNQFTVLPSILMVCWVAVGGRGTLYGAVIGAVARELGQHDASARAGPTTGSTSRACCSSSSSRSSPGGIVGLVKLARHAR